MIRGIPLMTEKRLFIPYIARKRSQTANSIRSHVRMRNQLLNIFRLCILKHLMILTLTQIMPIHIAIRAKGDLKERAFIRMMLTRIANQYRSASITHTLEGRCSLGGAAQPLILRLLCCQFQGSY